MPRCAPQVLSFSAGRGGASIPGKWLKCVETGEFIVFFLFSPSPALLVIVIVIVVCVFHNKVFSIFSFASIVIVDEGGVTLRVFG